MAFDIDKIRVSEPPGPRRVLLALRSKGSGINVVADRCNCDKAVVSRVARGLNTTQLHGRIRAVVADITGLDEAWLFEQPSSTRQPVNVHDSPPAA